MLFFARNNKKHLKHKHPHSTNASARLFWLIGAARCLKLCLCCDKKHGSQKSNAEPTPLIYHVSFSNSPCSPCWPDNPCRQPQTNHIDEKGNSIWGSSQFVCGYNTPVSQMEIPQYVSQRAPGPVRLPKGHMICIFTAWRGVKVLH